MKQKPTSYRRPFINLFLFVAAFVPLCASAETFTDGKRVPPTTEKLNVGDFVWEPERAPAGPVLIVVAAAIAAFVQFGSLGMTAGVGALLIAIGAVEGNVLTPWLMSRVGAMNAVAVFVSLLFWGWIWGVWGLLLAVPITASVKAIAERIPDLSAIAELLKE